MIAKPVPEYQVHHRTLEGGWRLRATSTLLADFDPDDQWYFRHLTTIDAEYIRVGETMYVIQRRSTR